MDFLGLLQAEREAAKKKKACLSVTPDRLFLQQHQHHVGDSVLHPQGADLTLSTADKVVDLSSFQVAPNVFYVPDVLSAADERNLMSCINSVDNGRWEQLKTRRLQCWYDHDDSVNTFTPWLQTLIDAILMWGIFDAFRDRPNHVLINEYKPHEGILHHTDGPRYLNRVAILSLNSSCLMTFRHRLKPEHIGIDSSSGANKSGPDGSVDEFSVTLRPRSLLVFCDSVYSEMLHGISDSVAFQTVGGTCPCVNTTLAGVVDGETIERASRTSLTVRKMLEQATAPNDGHSS